MGAMQCCVLGTSPLVMNRMAEKARQQLLLPARRGNQAKLDSNLKHDPLQEFRSSMYVRPAGEKTLFAFPGNGFSKALASAALDVPGSAAKAQIARLVRVTELNVAIYGIPKLYMAVVRQSGIDRTPDIRTRSIFSEWAARITVQFVQPQLNTKTIANLLGAAGLIIGVGDQRLQKGESMGGFRLCDADDPDFVRICKEGGRNQQQQAYDDPEMYDAETESLFSWFQQEIIERQRQTEVVAPKRNPRKVAA